jgi:hypothetical protein
MLVIAAWATQQWEDCTCIFSIVFPLSEIQRPLLCYAVHAKALAGLEKCIGYLKLTQPKNKLENFTTSDDT